MKYLIHNIYGDADHLINTAPSDVVCVPFGWSDEIEAERNTLLADLNVNGVSCLPCLLHFVESYQTTITNPDTGQEEIISVPSHWKELRIIDVPTPWSWDQINHYLNNN